MGLNLLHSNLIHKVLMDNDVDKAILWLASDPYFDGVCLAVLFPSAEFDHFGFASVLEVKQSGEEAFRYSLGVSY